MNMTKENRITKDNKNVVAKKRNVKNKKSDEGHDTVKMYLEGINRYTLLEFEEEKELSRRIQEENDEKALNKLINSNLRLVVKISKSYISTGYPLIDIIQEGNLGLIKAASKYDYKKDVRFSTYASWWIKQTITRSISVKRRAIRLSHRKEEKLRRIKRTESKFYQKNKEMPSTEELSKILNISEKEVKEILSYSTTIISIEGSANDDDNFSLKNMIEDNSFVPEEMFENKSLERETQKIMSTLLPRERVILSFRYGFNDKNKKYTLKKMGEMFGISAETVRQIELKALSKIREKYPHLKDFLRK